MNWFIVLIPFAFLWYRVIDSVCLEWSTNPQYSYGWIVPFLCVGLILRNWTSITSCNQNPASPTASDSASHVARASSPAGSAGVPPGVSETGDGTPAEPAAGTAALRYFQIFAFCFLLFLFLPARLVAASTPEWRPLQWVLALIAVGSTLYLIGSVWGRLGVRTCGFAVCFFLIAVPWPTPIEQPIIQSLTRLNTSVVVEVMGVLGIPAIQHGNIIEVGSGVVGIDEACSGIRSFQSSLMISLFLGEFYWLCWGRRIILLASGIALSFAFNVCRTSFLTWIAAKKGVAAIADYHDPAGLAILVACTLTLWLVGMYLGCSRVARASSPAGSAGVTPGVSDTGGGTPAEPAAGTAALRSSSDSHVARASSPASSTGVPPGVSDTGGGTPPEPAAETAALRSSPISAFLPLSLIMIAWLATVEIGTTLWFSHLESKLVTGPDWTMSFPTNEPSFTPFTIGEKTYGLLRYDEGKEGEWKNFDGMNWHAFYFNWLPGRVAGYLAKRHTPEICMDAAGQKRLAGPDLFIAKVHNIELPIRQYLYEYQGIQMHVFHCRWEVGADQSAAAQYESSRLNLIRGIWAGRGKNGQKVLEFMVTGYDTPEQARAALIRQLETLVVLEKNRNLESRK